MRTAAAIASVMLAAPAWAGWPLDVVISEMGTFEGAALAQPPTAQYLALIDQLGVAVVANPAALPAATTGLAGWDVALQTTFGFVPAYPDEGGPSGWQLAHPDGKPESWTFTPGLTMRKGLPWGVEVGARGAWFGGTSNGVIGGFARFAPLEGSQPAPDLAFQVGYAALVGNPELEVGALDLTATLGTAIPLLRREGVTFSTWEPWFSVTALRLTATPRLDPDTLAATGAVKVGGRDADETARWLARYAAGFQITTGRALMRVASDWSPGVAPTLTVALGYTL